MTLILIIQECPGVKLFIRLDGPRRSLVDQGGGKQDTGQPCIATSATLLHASIVRHSPRTTRRHHQNHSHIARHFMTFVEGMATANILGILDFIHYLKPP